MATHEAAAAATPTTFAARRSAAFHFTAAVITTAYPFLGTTGLPTPVQAGQIVVGILGAVSTYIKGGRTFKVAIPLLTAGVISALPALQGLDWHDITRATVVAALAHVLAAVANGLFPNDSTGATSTPPAVAPVASIPAQAAPVESGVDLASLALAPRAGDDDAPPTSQFYAFAPATPPVQN